jgi:hypothetical protein
MPTTTPARPGQTWQSIDRREDRRVAIEAISGHPPAGHAYAHCRPVGGGRRTYIHLDHYGQLRRYRLVEDTTTTEEAR